MSDLIGIALIVFLIVCGVIGIHVISKPYNVSPEEFERRASDGPGLLGASLVGLQKALDPAMERAVEVQEDLRQGRYDDEQDSGDPPEAGHSNEAGTMKTPQSGAGESDA